MFQIACAYISRPLNAPFFTSQETALHYLTPTPGHDSVTSPEIRWHGGNQHLRQKERNIQRAELNLRILILIEF